MIPRYSSKQFLDAKSRDSLELQCEFCHKPFLLIKKRILESIQNNHARFCSRQCHSNSQKKTYILTCNNCKKEIKRTASAISQTNFCSSRCNAVFHNQKRIKPKQPKQLKQPKQPNYCLYCKALTLNKKFCSGSCRNKINNIKICGLRSYAEDYLVKQIRIAFPHWEVKANDRIVLDGLELDVYIPHLKLGIEWNGIFHYEPIRGQSKLGQIQNKDSKKIELCKEKGIELIIICDRTSHKKFIKETVDDIIDKLKILACSDGNAPS